MNCDPLARWYYPLEYLVLGRALTRRRLEFLADLAADAGVRRALLLGDGDGRFLALFLAANTTVVIDSVDNSGRMLALARRRAEGIIGAVRISQRVTFHQADALHWMPPTGCVYDAVVSHFFLDCLSEPQIHEFFVRLRPFLAADATWIVSEFRQPASGLAAWRAKLWIGGLYHLFGWLTGLNVRRLPDYRAALSTLDFRLETERISNFGLLVSERWRRAG